MALAESAPRDNELHRGRIDTKEGVVHYGRILPKESPSGRPLLFLPGYGEGIGTMTPVAKTLADAHNGFHTHETFVVAHARRDFKLSIKRIKELYPAAPVEALELGLSILRRAHEAILVLDRYKTKAHLVGHSLGGMTGVAIALLRPDLVESLILINSAGVVRKKNALKLLARFLWNWVPEFLLHPLKVTAIIIRTFSLYIAGNPMRAFGEELPEAAHANMTNTLVSLGKRGVKITLVYDRLDQVFPSKQVEEQVQIAGGKNAPFKTKKTFGHFHYGPVTSPKVYGRTVNELLDDVERR